MPFRFPIEPPLRAEADEQLRVGPARVTRGVVVTAFRAGATPEEVVLRFPTLALAEVCETIAFYLRDADVDAYLARREGAAQDHRARAEAVEPMAAVRDRLRARQRMAS